MLLSAVSVLVGAQSSSEIPEGLMNNPVYRISHGTRVYQLIYINRPSLSFDMEKIAYCS